MAQQTVLWTVLPNGKLDGRWRVSVVVSPRLTPQGNSERLLGAGVWKEWANWPATLARQGLVLEIGTGSVPLRLIDTPETAPDSRLWEQLFYPKLPVAPFQFKDMSQVNLRSFPLRPLLGLVRKHYQLLSLQAGQEDHPILLPWNAANPVLKGLLRELGTRTIKQDFGQRSIEHLLPGFSRFHTVGTDGKRPQDRAVDQRVFNASSCIKAPARRPGRKGRQTVFPLRALPPVWEDPALIRNGSIPVSPADREARAQLMEQFATPAEYALWQADRFYNRTVPTAAQRAMKRPGFSGMAAAIVPPEFDFHQRIASYGDHTNLLRRLGLVIDCVLERNDLLDALISSSGPATGFMRLKLTAAAPHQPAGDQFPSTVFSIGKHRFVMQARTPDHTDDLLKLQGADDGYGMVLQGHDLPSPFDVYQLDPDGAALKTVNFLLTAQNLVGKHLEIGADGGVTYTTGDRQPVSALRSGGIGVSRHGRAGMVGMAAATAALNNAAIVAGGAAAREVTLFAEDVLRGYRVDVMNREVGRWQSLCARAGNYLALAREDGTPAMPIALPTEEGHVKGASTTSAEGKPDDHYLHETLFRWTGWSLAAPRPGRTVRDAIVPGTHLQVEEVVDGATEAAPRGNGLSVKFAALKGSLPRLRFGQGYRMRARLVDLAGNSLALEEPDLEEQASDLLRYGRFEPVDPPALVLRGKLSEGESLERMVLRSNFDRRCGDYTNDIKGPLAGDYDNPDFEYAPIDERHIVPPKSSQQQCELHGMFDAAIGSQDANRIKEAYAIAARESGSLMHPQPGAQIELVTPAKAAQAATVQGAGAMILPPEQADDSRDRFAAGQYLIHREAQVPVPYLPDPACGGIALQGVPGLERWTAGKPIVELAPGLLGYVLDKGARAAFFPDTKWRLILLLDFDRDPADEALNKEWPQDVRSLRLVLNEQPGEVTNPPCGDEHTEPASPKWDFAKGVLQLFLPKGFVARLRYASFVHDQLVQHFGLPNWHEDAAKLRLRVEALAGCNWMLTPWRALTLVHATQQPVCAPRLEQVSLPRKPGEQHVDLLARHVVLHGPSTGKFEIVGEWDEWVDDPLVDDPEAPGPRRVHHEATLSEIRLAENHRNRFPLADAVAAQNAFTPNGGQVIPTDLAKRPALPGNRHEFGDTRFRFIRYRLRATTRFREYLPPKLFARLDKITQHGPWVETDQVQVQALSALGEAKDAGAPVLRVTQGGKTGSIVRSSAAPDVPELVYVVPTFRWSRPAASGNTRTSTRLGNGLRVYLERPWFSSGDGELLGVVIPGDGVDFSQIDPARLPLVTQWGQDPMWDAARPDTRSQLNDFPAAVNSEMLLLQELEVGVHVVGHRVHFDAARKLWYCDIEINPGVGYMPFVRLALVRYQPHAVQGAKISRVLLTDFAQLLPRRRAVLVRDGINLTVTVHGPAAQRGPMRRHNPGGMSESEYLNLSLSGPGGDDGRNRLELIIQTQPDGLDSDLGWSDGRVLASGLVGGTPASRSLDALLPEGIQVQAADEVVSRRIRGGHTVRFDRIEGVTATSTTTLGSEALGGTANTGLIGQTGQVGQVGEIPGMFDPAVWSQKVRLPLPMPNFKHRLMLREFERFYTDRTVPEQSTSGPRRRVVVEERLVYAEVFALG